MKALLTILLLTFCLQAMAQVKQYQCYEYTVRGTEPGEREVVQDTLNISIMDSLIFIPLPGHDMLTPHRYALLVLNKTRYEEDIMYFLVFIISRRPAWLLVSDHHLYFWHDREEYLFFIHRKNYN